MPPEPEELDNLVVTLHGSGASQRDIAEKLGVTRKRVRRILALNEKRKFEGVLGTWFSGEAVAAARRNGVLYVTPRVSGRAFLTGFHQFVLDPVDPLPEGFRIGPTPRREPRLPQ